MQGIKEPGFVTLARLGRIKSARDIRNGANWEYIDAFKNVNLGNPLEVRTILEHTGITYGSLRQYRKLARAWPPEERKWPLLPGYYRAVPSARSRRDEAAALLQMAHERKLGISQFRTLVRQYERRNNAKSANFARSYEPDWSSLAERQGVIEVHDDGIWFRPRKSRTLYLISNSSGHSEDGKAQQTPQ